MPRGQAVRLYVAEPLEARLLGLAGLSRLPPAVGLLLPRCRSVHTFGMRFEIDVAFLTWPAAGKGAAVTALAERLAPLRAASNLERPRRQTAVLELLGGQADRLGLAPGAHLDLPPSDCLG